MKGLLANKDGSVVLSRNSMTVGRRDCDVNIDDPRVESCHAVLEFNAEKQCYVLRDLNTDSGTYVNDCRIQNNAVYVTDGDVIRFGQGGKPHELKLTESTSPMTSSVGLNRTPITCMVGREGLDMSLPKIYQKPIQTKPLTLPHPPIRPRSACEYDRLQPLARTAPDSPSVARPAWNSTPSLDSLLKPKLQKLLEMVEEMNKIPGMEQTNEISRKDAVINAMRDEIAELYQQLAESKFTVSQNLSHELYHVERELEERRLEVSLLRQQLESAMKSSPTLTTQLAEKDKTIHEFRHDLDKVKREYSMSQGLVQSLQRELNVKESELKRKFTEINQLKRNVKDKDIQFQSLTSKFVRTHDCTNKKDDTIAAVNDELKNMKMKIRRLESRSGDHTSLIQRYKNDIQQLNEVVKKQETEKNSLEKKFDEQKGKYLELQRAERLLRVDVEQMKCRLNRLRAKISKILYSASGVRAPDHPDDAEDSRLVVDLETIIDEREKHLEDIRSMKQDLDLHQKTEEERDSSLGSLKETLEDVMTSLADNGHHLEVLKNKQESLAALELEKSVAWVAGSASRLLKSEERWLCEIYDALGRAGHNVEVVERKPGYFILQMHDDILRKQERINELQQEMEELKIRHERELDKRNLELDEGYRESLSAEIFEIKKIEKEERERALAQLTIEEQEKFDIELQKERERFQKLSQTVEELRTELEAKAEVIEELESKLIETQKNLDESNANVTQLKEDLKTILLQRESMSQAGDIRKQERDKEIDQYKEEIKQHSITIVEMEERIKGIMKQLHKAQEEAEQLRSELRESDQAKHRLAPSPPLLVPPPLFDVGAYEQTIALLRSDLLASQDQMRLQQNDIINLQRELTSSRARMSDLTGELSESQKEELEHGRKLIREQELEMAKLRENLHKMSKLVDRQKGEITSMKDEIKSVRQAVVVKEEMSQEIPAPRSGLGRDRIETAETSTQAGREGRINVELTSLGAECRGERHAEVINRQREALAELRARIKALENATPVTQSREEIQQQVILLKKELAEIRARQVMEKDTHFRDHLIFSHSGDRSARDISPTEFKPIDADIERTARLQLEDTVNSSEQSYMDMCNVVGGLLNIASFSGLRSMNHLPVDERQKLSDERRNDLELISQQIKSITNRLDRKDNLLQNYDKDLAKLREAEEKATQKAAKVGVLLDEISTKTEENAHLREALRRTEERLHQEKRLNSAIKEKKTFHLENLDHRDPPAKHGECLQLDVKEQAIRERKKQEKSNLMKKEYEIQMLRQKLRSQEQELCRTAAQAANLTQQQHPGRKHLRKSSYSDSSSSTSVSSRSSHSRSSRKLGIEYRIDKA